MKRTFDVIVADPAWAFSDVLKKMKRKTKRGAAQQYKTMSVAEIIALPVKQLINPTGTLLALWVPGTLLLDGLAVMKAWGFTYKQNFVWVKLKKDHKKEADPNCYTRVGMGHLFRQSHEICLIGVAGKSVVKKVKNKGQRSVAFDLNVGHSTKPGTLQARLEKMFPDAEKLELYARRTRKGWTCLGDGIDGRDLNVSLVELVTGVVEDSEEIDNEQIQTS